MSTDKRTYDAAESGGGGERDLRRGEREPAESGGGGARDLRRGGREPPTRGGGAGQRVRAAWRRAYGSSPLHLLAHLATFAVAALVVSFMVDERAPRNALLWFLAAIVLHDLLVLPLYSVLDRIVRRAAAPSAINYVRVPALLSALLFAVYFPLIVGADTSQRQYARNAGFVPDGYLERYLLVVAVLFAGSLAAYLLRVRRAS